MFSSSSLKTYAYELGFNLVGITPAEPSPYLAAYFRWVEAGMQGTMGYMARPDRQDRRRDMNVILPGVRSLVMVALDYATATVTDDYCAHARLSNYVWMLYRNRIKLEHAAEGQPPLQSGCAFGLIAVVQIFRQQSFDCRLALNGSLRRWMACCDHVRFRCLHEES